MIGNNGPTVLKILGLKIVGIINHSIENEIWTLKHRIFKFDHFGQIWSSFFLKKTTGFINFGPKMSLKSRKQNTKRREMHF